MDELAATGAFVKFWKRRPQDSAAHTSEINIAMERFCSAPTYRVGFCVISTTTVYSGASDELLLERRGVVRCLDLRPAIDDNSTFKCRVCSRISV